MNGIDLRGERWQEVYTKIDLANEIRRLTARVEELELMLSAFPPHKDIDALRARVAELEAEVARATTVEEMWRDEALKAQQMLVDERSK